MGVRAVQDDPLRNFKFRVTIGGDLTSRTGFKSVQGLKESTEVVEYREGTDAATPRKLFGQTTFDDVTFEAGLTNSSFLLSWRRRITDVTSGAGRSANAPSGEGNGNLDIRQTVTVDLIEYHARVQWSWDLIEAWPRDWEVGDFQGDGNDVVVEMMVLAHEGMAVTPPSFV